MLKHFVFEPFAGVGEHVRAAQLVVCDAGIHAGHASVTFPPDGRVGPDGLDGFDD